MLPLVLSAVVGAAVLMFAVYLAISVLRYPPGSGRALEIHEFIKEGARAYLRRQYGVIVSISVAIAVAILVASIVAGRPSPWRAPLLFLAGSFSSVAAGYFGMLVATRANVRTVNAVVTGGLRVAFGVAFKGGLVMGLTVAGLGTFAVAVALLALGFSDEVIRDSIYYAFGASAVALFARVGGGIYTKAADVGADLVGKVEVGIPEDDPRNPGVIADNVGDNVGDVAGMGADLFESYVEAIISTMVVALALAVATQVSYALLPLAVSAAGLVASAASVLFTMVLPIRDPAKALSTASLASAVLIAVLSLPVSLYLLGPEAGLRAWLTVVAGLVAGVVVGLTSDYFTRKGLPPTAKVAEMSQMGPALTILSGMSYGFMSVVIPSVGIAVAALVAYALTAPLGGFWYGIYGVALSAVGMLSLTGFVVGADAYGPITDNAAGIAEQAGFGEDVRSVTDLLDSAGNTMKSISKGYAIGSAALTALALLAAYISVLPRDKVDMSQLNLLNSYVVAGFFIGMAVPALFTSIVLRAVSDAAFELIAEIRRQFRERPGILEFRERPDYGRAVDVVTKYAIKRLVIPGLIAIAVPVVVGVTLGIYALAGTLAGAIVSGLLLGLFQGNVGNTWDNAKKYIEEGHFGGKGSEAHKAAVIGDTVGDPLKDAAGPSLNILIKLMSVVAISIAPVLAALA
ncbi:MAG: sodium-translocating pyrophosphatase [Desulfurococcaceae archaeon]|nr:sodium-translocating pyrophosphatase [Desulfurococcaceae archaeon]